MYDHVAPSRVHCAPPPPPHTLALSAHGPRAAHRLEPLGGGGMRALLRFDGASQLGTRLLVRAQLLLGVRQRRLALLLQRRVHRVGEGALRLRTQSHERARPRLESLFARPGRLERVWGRRRRGRDAREWEERQERTVQGADSKGEESTEEVLS
eukprot:6213372-Pleurochrysis_carterae.AAC.2